MRKAPKGLMPPELHTYGQPIQVATPEGAWNQVRHLFLRRKIRGFCVRTLPQMLKSTPPRFFVLRDAEQLETLRPANISYLQGFDHFTVIQHETEQVSDEGRNDHPHLATIVCLRRGENLSDLYTIKEH